MKKTLRNFWLDAFLILLLGLNITAVIIMRPQAEGVHPDLAWHVHVVIGVLMAIGCLIHIVLHWQWLQAVLTGKAKGRVKLFMNSMVSVMLLLSVASGHEAFASGFHGFVGSMALIGLFIHSIKHMRWMVSMAKKLRTSNQHELATQSA